MNETQRSDLYSEPLINRPASLIKCQTTPNIHSESKNLTNILLIGSFQLKIFYVNEFLDMIREFQEKNIFSQLIYSKENII